MFTPTENRLGIQPIAVANIPLPSGIQVGQSQYFGKAEPLGTIVRAYDPIYGEGEFIYLQMAATQAVGSLVTWGGFGTVPGDGAGNEAQYQAVLATNATTAQGKPLAVAMSAFPSGSPATAFGWFQIGGQSVMASTGTVTAAAGVALGSTTGQVTAGPVAGKNIFNAVAVTANGTPAANFAVVEINRPFEEPLVT